MDSGKPGLSTQDRQAQLEAAGGVAPIPGADPGLKSGNIPHERQRPTNWLVNAADGSSAGPVGNSASSAGETPTAAVWA